MDMESYEQVDVDAETLKGKGGYLTDGQEVKVLTYNGKVIDLQLAASVVMQVADTEPGIKGDTVSGASKPATLESGITINVPLFIEPGDMIKVDTRSGEYLGRQ
jgi:elongation factor P